MSLVMSLLRRSDLGSLAQFVSPQFFSVVPARDIASLLSAVLRRSRDPEQIHRARLEGGKLLAPLQVALVADSAGPARGPLDAAAGERILQVYFRQLMNSSGWFLDFRSAAWSQQGAQMNWAPAPFLHAPTLVFQTAIRDLYRGFYENDLQRFRGALSELGLAAAEAELTQHFGLEGQSAVNFSLRGLQHTLGSVFQACARQTQPVHPEFALLGAMLLSLYEVLESLGRPLDVRRAYLEACHGI